MPAGVRNLRRMFHATAVEVLLYLTPVHCQDMLDSLTTSLNATFTSFMNRNPGFEVCHSTCVWCDCCCSSVGQVTCVYLHCVLTCWTYSQHPSIPSHPPATWTQPQVCLFICKCCDCCCSFVGMCPCTCVKPSLFAHRGRITSQRHTPSFMKDVSALTVGQCALVHSFIIKIHSCRQDVNLQ